MLLESEASYKTEWLSRWAGLRAEETRGGTKDHLSCKDGCRSDSIIQAKPSCWVWIFFFKGRVSQCNPGTKQATLLPQPLSVEMTTGMYHPSHIAGFGHYLPLYLWISWRSDKQFGGLEHLNKIHSTLPGSFGPRGGALSKPLASVNYRTIDTKEYDCVEAWDGSWGLLPVLSRWEAPGFISTPTPHIHKGVLFSTLWSRLFSLSSVSFKIYPGFKEQNTCVRKGSECSSLTCVVLCGPSFVKCGTGV